MGYDGSLSVDVNTFNQEASQSTKFGSIQRGVNSGSKIVKNSQGQYHIDDNNQRPPIPVHMSVRPITTALDQRLWTQLPESSQTYTSLGIATKLRNLKRALSQYAAWTRAPTSSGKLKQCMSIGDMTQNTSKKYVWHVRHTNLVTLAVCALIRLRNV